jgi:hypothetical protein
MRSNAAVQSNTEPSRQAVVNEYQRPEAVWILHKEFDGEATLSITSEGKSLFFKVNRRQLFNLMSQGHKALADMEPHTPAGWP